jgi:hypothetical protein
MLGAITTNLRILKVDTWLPLGLLAISALVAWACWAEVRQALSLRSQGSDVPSPESLETALKEGPLGRVLGAAERRLVRLRRLSRSPALAV